MDREYIKSLIWYYKYLMLKGEYLYEGLNEDILKKDMTDRDILYHALVRWTIVHYTQESEYFYPSYNTPSHGNCMACGVYDRRNKCFSDTPEKGLCPIGESLCTMLCETNNVDGFLLRIWEKLFGEDTYETRVIEDHLFLVKTVKQEFGVE